MTKYLLKNVTIVDPHSDFNQWVADILISEGKIEKIAKAGTKDLESTNNKRIDLKGRHVSPGFCDLATWRGEPGYEHRETLDSLAKSAIQGGFTDLAVLPNVHPVADHRSAITFLKSRAADLPCRLHPIGAISEKAEGKELAELRDMAEGGAVAFSDGFTSIQESALLLRALIYGKGFGAKVLHHPSEAKTFPKGLMHEGIISTKLGTKGIPVAAEVMAIQRDLELVRYANAPLHFLGISSKRGTDLIRKAKEEGLPVSCSVPVWNIAFTDENINDFNIYFKFDPPLRDETDRLALIEGLKDGTIDAIYSHHMPWNNEVKNLEFPFSKAGAISLQTAFSLSCEVLSNHLHFEQIVQLWTSNPRNILGFKQESISEGNTCAMVIYETDSKWSFHKEQNESLSENSPLWDHAFSVKIKGVLIGNQYHGF
jgi:dihydroorotase